LRPFSASISNKEGVGIELPICVSFHLAKCKRLILCGFAIKIESQNHGADNQAGGEIKLTRSAGSM
jgi:hypothetical protein